MSRANGWVAIVALWAGIGGCGGAGGEEAAPARGPEAAAPSGAA